MTTNSSGMAKAKHTRSPRASFTQSEEKRMGEGILLGVDAKRRGIGVVLKA